MSTKDTHSSHSADTAVNTAFRIKTDEINEPARLTADQRYEAKSRCAVRYDSGVRYADNRSSATTASVALMLALIAFLAMIFTPLMRCALYVALVAIAASLFACFKSIKGGLPVRMSGPKIMTIVALFLALGQLVLIGIVTYAVCCLDYAMPY